VALDPLNIGTKEKLTITGLAIYLDQSPADRDAQILAMSRQLVFLIVAGFALSGCCAGSERYVKPATNVLADWDGLRPLPERNKVKRVNVRKKSADVALEENLPNEDELSKLKPYSKEWTAVLNAINAAADDKLKKQLIICPDCMRSDPEDKTGSIAAGGYLPSRR
jgi:hypothetical protein